MKSKSGRGRWSGPLRTLSDYTTAVALGGLVLSWALQDRAPAPPGGWMPGPRVAPISYWIAPGTIQGPVDRCLIVAPEVDARFVVVPRETNDTPFLVAPRVWGVPVGSVDVLPSR